MKKIAIILSGPPGVGKSSFAARFTLEHPWFNYRSIDGYRSYYKDEDLAWLELQTSINQDSKMIIESSGLSERLKPIIKSIKDRDIPTFSIGLVGDSEVIKKRIEQRQRPQIPYPFSWKETEAVEYILARMDKVQPKPDLIVDTTDMTKDQIYDYLNKKISHFQVERS